MVEFIDEMRKVHRDGTVLSAIEKRTVDAGMKLKFRPFRTFGVLVVQQFQRRGVQRDVEQLLTAVFKRELISIENFLIDTWWRHATITSFEMIFASILILEGFVSIVMQMERGSSSEEESRRMCALRTGVA
jgi:hypothetical protein